MTGTFFDTLTKALATRRSRRDAIRASGSGIVAGLAGSTMRPAAAQDATLLAEPAFTTGARAGRRRKRAPLLSSELPSTCVGLLTRRRPPRGLGERPTALLVCAR